MDEELIPSRREECSSHAPGCFIYRSACASTSPEGDNKREGGLQLLRGRGHLEAPGDNLHPIAVRIQRKGNLLDAPGAELLLELDPLPLQSSAGVLDVVDQEADVPEPAVGLGVAVVVLELGVTLGPVVVGELEDGDAARVQRLLHPRRGLGGGGIRGLDPLRKAGKEVQREIPKVPHGDQRHAELVDIECQAFRGVLDAHHGLGEAELRGVRSGPTGNYLHPVAVRVVGERKALQNEPEPGLRDAGNAGVSVTMRKG